MTIQEKISYYNNLKNVPQHLKDYYIRRAIQMQDTRFIVADNEYTGQAIYVIYNTEENKVYIGECENWKARVAQHKSRLRKGKHHVDALQTYFNQGGLLKFIILEKTEGLTTSEKHEIEKTLIEHFKEQAYNKITFSK